MKILQINCVYQNGSTGKIVAQLYDAIERDGSESVVVCSRNTNARVLNVYNVCTVLESKFNHLISRVTGLIYGGCLLQTARTISIIKKEKPDIVHLHCLNGYFINIYRLIRYLKNQHIPTVLTLHAEFMFTANCGCTYGCERWKFGCGDCPNLYKAVESYFVDRTAKSFRLMKNAFDGFDCLQVVGVSNWLSNRARESAIMKNKPIITIKNGIDIDTFNTQNNALMHKGLRQKNKEKKTVLWVTSAYTHEKGKDFFVELSKKLSKEKYNFIIVGTKTPSKPVEGVKFLGKITDQKQLANIYLLADVTVCCSLQESYPTVCLESACCGTPVVGFDTTGISEAIYPGIGETVLFGDVDKMCGAVEYWADKKSEISYETIERCREEFSTRRMQKEYLHLYKKMMGKEV